MSKLFVAYVLLLLAIICEVAGTSCLQRSQQFSRLLPSVGVVIFYVASFILLSYVLKTIPLGIAYAIWAGVGIILTAAAGVMLFHQALDLGATIGIGLIVSGVIVINVFSSSVTH